MAEFHYEALSYLDASFLALETRSTHMHVAAVTLFDAHPLTTADGGIDIERVRAHVESKLQYIPRYRQRLDYVPYDRHPVWVDDAQFTLEYHLRHTSLPRPGSEAQLKALVGRIVSQPLDRNKPLWELWVVEGVDGDRLALIAKIHHCMIDGISGIDLTTILLNMAPTTEIEPTPPWTPRPAPAPTQLAVAEAARMTRRMIDRLSNLGEMLREGRVITERGRDKALAALTSLRSGWLTAASRTPLNPDIGPNRRFDWTEMALDRIKTIKNNLRGSVNDVVLAVVAGAVRRFLMEHRHFDVEGVEFRVMNPVSTRTAERRGALGNQVSMWLLDFPIAETDPVKRYQLIRERTMTLKKSKHALGAATLVELSSGTPVTLLSLANRLVGPRMRPFNMTVTNVPGPQFPLYLLESRMLATYPIVPLWAQHGLGVALFSYDGRLLWGIHADYDALPDSEAFITCIHDAIAELETAAAA